MTGPLLGYDTGCNTKHLGADGLLLYALNKYLQYILWKGANALILIMSSFNLLNSTIKNG